MRKLILCIVALGALVTMPAVAAGTGISALSGKVGIWFFYASTCPYCAKQEPILYRIQKEYGIPVLPISLDGGPTPDGLFKHYQVDHGQGTRLSVRVTPTLFLVNPQRDQAVELSQGLLPASRLIQRMVAAATNAGWLKGAAPVDGTDASVLHGRGTPVEGATSAPEPPADAPLWFSLKE